MNDHLNAVNTAVSALAQDSTQLAGRTRELLKQIEISVQQVLKQIETYIHPERAADIRMLHGHIQAMGDSVLASAKDIPAHAAAAHDAIVLLDKALNAPQG